MTISLIKSNPNDEKPTWIVKDADDFLGEIIHTGFRQWASEAMDGTHFCATSRREAVMRLRIHRAAA